MAAEILTEDLLRISLRRLANQVERSHPEFREALAMGIVRTCGLVPDAERAEHYMDLGALLIDLGRLYIAEADVLRPSTEGREDLDAG